MDDFSLSELVEAAQTAVAQGDLAQAIILQQRAIELVRQAGNRLDLLQARSILLFNLANFYEANGRLADAVAALEEVVALDEQTDSQDLAPDLAALARMRHLVALPPDEQAQVALLEVQAAIQMLAEQAEVAQLAQDVVTAVAAQEQAVALAQELGNSVEALTQLSLLLHNLAGYYQDAGRLDEAVAALEVAVAIGSQIDAPELAEDEQALVQLRQLAAMSPREREELLTVAQKTAEQLKAMSLDEKAHLQASVRQANENLAAMSPTERKMAMLSAAKITLVQLAEEVTTTAVAVCQGTQPAAPLLAHIHELLVQITDNSRFGVSRYEFVAYLQTVAAFLRGESVKSIPKEYQTQFKRLRRTR